VERQRRYSHRTVCHRRHHRRSVSVGLENMEKSGNLKVVGNNLGGCVLDCGVLLVSNFIRKVESVPDTLSKHLKKNSGESHADVKVATL